MPLVLLPFLLLIVPILEIATFITVGRWIGLWPTLGLVIASAVIGAALLKHQGLSTLRRIQSETAAGRMPGRELIHGVMIVAAGVLLLTPGLLTDVVGYLLFVPAVRSAISRLLTRRITVNTIGAMRRRGDGSAHSSRGEGVRHSTPDVVDLPAEDFERRPNPSSPWNSAHEGNRTLH